MSLTKVQSANTSNNGGTSLTLNFTAAGAGNLLVLATCVGGTATLNPTSGTPAGWTKAIGPIGTEASADVDGYLFWKVAAGGETSVTSTDSVSSGITMQLEEWSSTNGWPANPVDVFASSAAQAATTSPVSGTTAATANAVELAIAALFTHFATGETFSSPTNSFTADGVATAGASSFFAPSCGLFYRVTAATGAQSMSATAGTSKPFGGLIVVFKDNGGGGGTAWFQALTDAFSETDVRASQSQKPLSDAISETDAALKTPQKLQVDAFSETDAATRATQKALTDATSALDTFSRTWLAHLLFTDFFSETDAQSKAVARTLLDTQSGQDLVQKLVARTLFEAQSATDTQTKITLVALVESISTTESHTAGYTKAIFDSLSATDTVTAGRVLLLTLLDHFSVLDSLGTPQLSHPTAAKKIAIAASIVASLLNISVILAIGSGITLATAVVASPLTLGIATSVQSLPVLRLAVTPSGVAITATLA